MMKLFKMLLVLAVVFVGAFAASPTFRESLHWRMVSATAGGDYESFLGKWPQSPHADEARVRMDEQRWQAAERAHSEQALANYLHDHPQGRHAAEAITALEAVRWDTARKAASSAGYRGYLRQYPSGAHAAEAVNNLEALEWDVARKANTPAAYRSYLSQYPSGPNATEAAKDLEDLEWEAARKTNTPAAYSTYLSEYPNALHAREAKQARTAALRDEAPFEAVRGAGSAEAYQRFIQDYPGHRRIHDAEAALKEMAGRDIVDLLADKRIQVKIQGGGIESVSLEIRRLTTHPIRVRIPVGTFFVSRSASAQNMVARTEELVELRNTDWTWVSVAAACANRPRDIPDDQNRFTVRRTAASKELQKLMPALSNANVPFSVEQAAVWIVTDNADYEDLGILVQSIGGLGFGGERVIDESAAARAMRIVDDAGIDITRKSIWSNRREIARGAKDEEFSVWLKARGEAKRRGRGGR